MSDFDLFDVAGDILQGVAPVIGTALGGPLGGAAAGYIAKAIFGDEERSEEEIAAALKSGQLTPEQYANLKQAEIDFKKHLADNDIKIDEISAKDRDSARNLTARLAEKGHKAAWSAPLISLVVIVGFFGILYAVMTNSVDETMRDPLLILLGALGAGFTQTLNFWLGSSKGSKDKTEALGQAMKNDRPAS